MDNYTGELEPKKTIQGNGVCCFVGVRRCHTACEAKGRSYHRKDLAISHGRSGPEEKTTGHTQSFHLAVPVSTERKRIE